MFRVSLFLLALLGFSWHAAVPTPTRLLITVEPHKGATPNVTTDTIEVRQEGKADRITGLAPEQSGRGLQLLLLLDDGSDSAVATQFPDIRQFLTALPSGAQAGVGYIRNGDVQVVAAIGPNLGAAAGSLRLPLGEFGVNPSPYNALSEMAAHWPATAPGERREIVIVTPGIELLGTPGPLDPYMTAAIAALQRAGIVVFAVFTPAAGHWGHVFWRDFTAQSQLSQVSDETGGEAYMLGYGTQEMAASFQDIQRKLSNQYLVTFEAQPPAKPGLIGVRARATTGGFDVLAADHVFVTP